MIPYSRLKRSDLYTLSYSDLLENYTLHSGTYLYSPYMPVPPPPGPMVISLSALWVTCHQMSLFLPFFGGDFRGKEDLIHNFTDGCVSKVQNLDFCLIGQKNKRFHFLRFIYLAFGAL